MWKKGKKAITNSLPSSKKGQNALTCACKATMLAWVRIAALGSQWYLLCRKDRDISYRIDRYWVAGRILFYKVLKLNETGLLSVRGVELHFRIDLSQGPLP